MYDIDIILTLDKSEATLTETISLIRAIGNITVVTKREIEDAQNHHKFEARLKVVLPIGTSISTYVKNTLMIKLNKIRGLSVNKLMAVKKIDPKDESFK